MLNGGTLTFPGLSICQGSNKKHLYCFPVDGKMLPNFTTISRIHRNDQNQVGGYQRPEIINHIAEIRNYLESSSPLIPNAIIVAFNKRFSFHPTNEGSTEEAEGQAGRIEIALDGIRKESDKPGWIVDGQQRIAALREAKLEKFPIFVIGFVAENEQEQRDQFILVNSTKSLPKSLIYELLPETGSQLPSFLEGRKLPSLLLVRLNFDEKSPLLGLIKTPTNPQGLIKDNSILRMLENSLNDGVLFRYRNVATGEDDIDGMIQALFEYWKAVKIVFKDAWGRPPNRSRLFHGAGIISLGYLMDAISDRYRREKIPDRDCFLENLKPLKEICCWTNGHWEFGMGSQRKWNELQNTSSDIQLLASFLLYQYREIVWK